jgi:AcrR family transcriptional regulator
MIPNEANCKRPYTLGKRAAESEQKRLAVLKAARAQLESGGYLNLTMDLLARESRVTRQTVHNLFKTKAGVLEALFDQLALDGGMMQMATVMREGMRQANAEAMLDGFVRVFTGFWSRDRLLIRRIHGIAAIDPEFGAAVEARNRRRQMAATRVAGLLGQMDRMEGMEGARVEGTRGSEDSARQAAALYALTSFEFFDALAESLGELQGASETVLALARMAMVSQR